MATVESSRPPLLDLDDANRDLGFGSVVASESKQRLLNRNGSFNVRREGMRSLQSLSLYHYLLTASWPKFLGMVIVGYLMLNAFFAYTYVLCGPGALAGASVQQAGGTEFLRAFFFSVETFATIGYGHIAPSGLAANIVVTIESLVGLLGFALATGLLFARFSRPNAMIVFSRRALVSPYRGGKAFEFRIVNSRESQLIEVECQLLYSYLDDEGGRQFTQLNLERRKVTFFPLGWTIVHPMDESSPLAGLTHDDLVRSDAEFLVLLTGFDETFSQTVHTRSSYKPQELVWGAAFETMFKPRTAAGVVRIDMRRLHDYREVPLPA